MIRKLWILFVIIIVFFHKSDAQISTNTPSGAVIRTVRYVGIPKLNTPREYEIQGSPYLTNEFIKGTIFLVNGTYHDVHMRYNIYFDQVEFMNQDSIFALRPDPIVHKIAIGVKTFVVDALDSKGQKYHTFFERLDSGKITLMAKIVVMFRDSCKASPCKGMSPHDTIAYPIYIILKLVTNL